MWELQSFHEFTAWGNCFFFPPDFLCFALSVFDSAAQAITFTRSNTHRPLRSQ